jgi:peptide/nickel transport system permease protein
MTAQGLERRAWLGSVRRVSRTGPMMLAGVAVLALVVMAAIAAPLIAPADPNAVDLSASLSGASRDHLLGADQSGRDVLARLIHGARVGLLGPLVVVIVSTIFGTIAGVTASWRGGFTDTALSRAMDLIFAFPALLLAILLVAMFGAGFTAPVVAMSLAYVPYVGRLVRGVARQEQSRPYIEAYRVQGFAGWVICLRHLVPNIAPLVLAQSSINFGYAVMDLAALSFLGFGVQPPTPDWGAMINDGTSTLLQGATLPALAPAAAVVLTVVAFTVVGEGLADRVARREAR